MIEEDIFEKILSAHKKRVVISEKDKIYEFSGGQDPGPDLPNPEPSKVYLYECREDIPTLGDMCSYCGKKPICFLEERSSDHILEVFDKCKSCLLFR